MKETGSVTKMQMPSELIAAFKAIRGDDAIQIVATAEALPISTVIAAQRRQNDIERIATNREGSISATFNRVANIGDRMIAAVRRDITGPISAPRKDSVSRQRAGLVIRNGYEMLGDVPSSRPPKK